MAPNMENDEWPEGKESRASFNFLELSVAVVQN